MTPPLAEAERAAYAQVDAALRTYPLAPTPRSLKANVLAAIAIATQPGAAAPAPFRVGWLDLALSAFVSGMLGLLLLLGHWATTPPGRLLLAHLWLVVQLAHVPAWAAPLLGGLALAAVVLMPAALFLTALRRGGWVSVGK